MANEQTSNYEKDGATFPLDETDKDETDGDKEVDNTSIENVKYWNFFGHNIPKPEIIFFSQIIIIYIVVISSLINIAFAEGDDKVWISLLCSCLGYMLPNPSLPTENTRFKS